MTTEEALKWIESASFSAHVGLASGLRLFRQATLTNPAVSHLLELPATALNELLLRRVDRAARGAVDLRYRHPQDDALAAYVVLAQQRLPSLRLQLLAMLRSVSGLWWTAQLVGQWRGDPVRTETADSESPPAPVGAANAGRMNTDPEWCVDMLTGHLGCAVMASAPAWITGTAAGVYIDSEAQAVAANDDGSTYLSAA